MQQNESVVTVMIIKGEILFNEGKVKEAEEHFLHLLSQYPSNPTIYNNLGAIKFSQGCLFTAKEYFLSALVIDGNNYDALSNLKELYKNYGSWGTLPQRLIDAKTGADFFAKAFTLYPKAPEIHNDIGIIQLKAGQCDKAEKSFLTAINLDPSYQEAFYNLGRLFMLNERYAEAIGNFIAVGILNPENELAEKAILEYQNDDVIIKIGKKYKNILIVMEEDSEHIVNLIPTLKAIKEILPECYITIFGCESAAKIIKERGIIDKVITQPDNQVYDIAMLTIWSSNFLSLHRSWLISNCRQFFLANLLRGQSESDSNFHLSRCLGYIKEKPDLFRDNEIKKSIQLTDNGKNKLLNTMSNTQNEKFLISKKQYFIGGTGCSGTSILMKLLNLHRELASFGEVQVLMNGINHLDKIINTPVPNREVLIKEFKQKWLNDYFEFIVPWKNKEGDNRRGIFSWFDKNDVLGCLPILDNLKQCANLQSAFKVFGIFIQALFDQYARKNNKPYWVEKTPSNAVYAPFLAQCFPNFKIVNIIRDGRDVACSLQNVGWGIEDPFKALDWWADNLTKAIEVQKYLAPGSFLNIRYEDLVYKTERTLKKVIDFFKLDWDNNLLNKSIYSSSINRYKNEMSHEVQKYAFEKYGDLLESFNY